LINLLVSSFASYDLELLGFGDQLSEVEVGGEPGLHRAHVIVSLGLEVHLVHAGMAKCHLKFEGALDLTALKVIKFSTSFKFVFCFVDHLKQVEAYLGPVTTGYVLFIASINGFT